MRRLLPFVTAVLPAIVAIALANPGDASSNGSISFNGQILDGNTLLAQGSVITIRGDVIARSENCIKARIASAQPAGNPELWLCSPGGRNASGMPNVGEPIAARARITGVRTAPEGEVLYSDSFVLLRVD
ncbi:MAG: hypothetical protein OJF55_002689 [Rhodanobacteraceae bacterium]|jgi:hypothetical protein|nr:MAG: hypothetical protein OJF55_002689 [Rhodanobacteraceae bacterium]